MYINVVASGRCRPTDPLKFTPALCSLIQNLFEQKVRDNPYSTCPKNHDFSPADTHTYLRFLKILSMISNTSVNFHTSITKKILNKERTSFSKKKLLNINLSSHLNTAAFLLPSLHYFV